MCGIYGFNWKDEELLQKMDELIKHRGPDGKSEYIDSNTSIGHRRLSIIDLSEKGTQPMKFKHLLLSFNGEIYNYQKLRTKLEQKGYNFTSETDSEVLLKMFHAYGEKSFSLFEGMFACAIYNTETKEFILARDRLGVKPLYYYADKNKLIFSSELKPMLVHNISKELHIDAIQELLTTGFITQPKSIISSIKKLGPGKIFSYNKGQEKIRSYWTLPTYTENKITIKKIQKQLHKAVTSRLVADVPVGCFLSGGVDSSLITAISSKHNQNLNTFSIAFDIAGFDETPFAQKVADTFNTNHHVFDFTSKKILEGLQNISSTMDEPYGESTAMATAFLSEQTRKKVKVALSGEGGDELFGGYSRYQHMLKFKKVQPLLKIHPNKKLRLLARKTDSEIYSAIRTINSSKTNILATDIQNYYQKFFTEKKVLNNLLKTDTLSYLPDDLLKNSDIQSMQKGLEMRVPFTDYKLVELAAQLPTRQKTTFFEKKILLKKIALAENIPKSCIYRKKKGFSIPINEYFRNELQETVYEEIKKLKKRVFINKEQLQNIYNNHISGKQNNGSLLLTLINLNKWLEDVEKYL